MTTAVAYMIHEGQAFGGSSVSFLSLMKTLDKERFRPLVICPRNSLMVESLYDMDIETRLIDYYAFDLRNPFRYLSTLNILRRTIKREKIELIHLNHQSLTDFAVMAAHLSSKPLVLHFRGIEEPSFINSYERWIRQADRIITVSKAVAENLEEHGLGNDRIRVIMDGTDIKRFQSSRENGFRREIGVGEKQPLVGIVSEIMAEKGLGDFLQAAESVLEKIPNAKFVVVGTDYLKHSYLDELKSDARRLGLAGKVLFTGFRKDVERVFRSLDVSVLASWQEAFGNVVVESMAAGTPVVATRVGGVPEIIDDRRNGLLVPPRNPTALANTIIEALSMNPDERKSLVRAAKQTVRDNFSITEQTKKIEHLYEELLGA